MSNVMRQVLRVTISKLAIVLVVAGEVNIREGSCVTVGNATEMGFYLILDMASLNSVTYTYGRELGLPGV